MGKVNIQKIKSCKILIIGLGGVGSYALEALARCGVSDFTLADGDKVAVSNINRQILATHKTIGMLKTEAAKQRVLDINPDANVKALSVFINKDNYNNIGYGSYDYVLDCIDMITAKLLIINSCYLNNVKIISAMGTGNKLDPLALKVGDVYNTTECPLAKIMRKELKRLNIPSLKCVYSTEKSLKADLNEAEQDSDIKIKRTVGSISFVPSAAGLIMAGEVVKDLINAQYCV